MDYFTLTRYFCVCNWMCIKTGAAESFCLFDIGNFSDPLFRLDLSIRIRIA